MSNKAREELEKVTYRLPPELIKAVQASARSDVRTISKQVTVLLREALAARERQQAVDLSPPSNQQS